MQRVPGARKEPLRGPEGVTFPASSSPTGPSGSRIHEEPSRKPRLRCGLPSHLRTPCRPRRTVSSCADRAVPARHRAVPAPQPCRPCAGFPPNPSRPGRLVAVTACPGRHETPGTHLGRPPRPRTTRGAPPRRTSDGRHRPPIRAQPPPAPPREITSRGRSSSRWSRCGRRRQVEVVGGLGGVAGVGRRRSRCASALHPLGRVAGTQRRPAQR